MKFYNNWFSIKNGFEFILFKLVYIGDSDFKYLELTIFNFEFSWTNKNFSGYYKI
jgi:hypothetical protein